YDYQLRHPRLDSTIRGLLRLYEGILHHRVTINERKLAAFIKISQSEVIQHLNQLKHERIIWYDPKDDYPRLIMLKERVPALNLTINQEMFRFRKERRLQNLKAIQEYLKSTSCRQEFILRYFDDPSIKQCGICDNCQAQTQSELKVHSISEVSKVILHKLQMKNMTIGALLESLPTIDRTRMVGTIQHLLDEERIFKKDELISIKP
ncbi:MAG: RecQ family zinc-binding domain-containing protein, partial [Saprospiraceae bacterium]|nr:RecQ family zinc-binding domain-containing protein [Saprospiraceae bacterium]